jgi:hypothetical protein
MLPEAYYQPADLLQPSSQGRYVCKPNITNNRLTARPVVRPNKTKQSPNHNNTTPENNTQHPTTVTLNEFNRQIRILAATIAQALLPFPLARTALNEAIQKLRPLFPEPFLEPTA